MRRSLAIVSAICLGASGAAGQPFTGDQYGDWVVLCAEPAGPCRLTQHVVAGNREGVELHVEAWRFPDGDPVLRVRVPLGVFLRAGIDLRIDDQAIGRMNFDVCTVEDCLAEVLLEDRLLELMRTGSTALLIFRLYDDRDDGIGVPISLAGFAPGFDALAPGP